MHDKLDELKKIVGEVADLGSAAGLLGWDQQTYMPAGGGEARGQQLATIEKLAHQKSTSDELGKLLDDLKKEFGGKDSSSDDAALVRVATRDYDKAVRIPA
jgi:carboxypeptidase Taq